MEQYEIVSNSEQDTKKLAKKMAEFFKNGNTLVLTGDLGAGKTKFVEGFLSFFNLENEISSPTFNIINEHHFEDINIYHFDVYRLENEDEFFEIGGEEYFEKGICILEWGETVKDVLPKDYLQIYFSRDSKNENKRIITIKAVGDTKKLLEKIANK